METWAGQVILFPFLGQLKSSLIPSAPGRLCPQQISLQSPAKCFLLCDWLCDFCCPPTLLRSILKSSSVWSLAGFVWDHICYKLCRWDFLSCHGGTAALSPGCMSFSCCLWLRRMKWEEERDRGICLRYAFFFLNWSCYTQLKYIGNNWHLFCQKLKSDQRPYNLWMVKKRFRISRVLGTSKLFSESAILGSSLHIHIRKLLGF